MIMKSTSVDQNHGGLYCVQQTKIKAETNPLKFLVERSQAQKTVYNNIHGETTHPGIIIRSPSRART